MKILSPAKINLFLEIGVLGKKLHNLISLVDIVDLYDTVEIEESGSTEVHFVSEWNIPPENTVTKTIGLLKSMFNIKKEVSIKIFKKIPPGSGLAGGSSNAAAVLKALVKTWNLRIPGKKLTDIAVLIGSDVPLFLWGRRCIIEGFGEKIRKDRVSDTPLAYYLLIPPFTVLTKDVYSRFDSLHLKGDLTGAREKIKLLIENIEQKNIENIEQIIQNRLERPYFSLWNRAEEVKKDLQEKTGKKFFVSGSGGAIFSVFPDRKAAAEKTFMLNVAGWKSYIVESMKAS